MAERPAIADPRDPQRFPTLEGAAIERLRHFGEVVRFRDGEALARAGQTGRGLTVVLSGAVQVSQADGHGGHQPIVEHGPGGFLGELAQLAGRPSMVDSIAVGPVEALVIPPSGLRAILVAEAELGEIIMRALILRRVGLLESGLGGPVIVGRPDDADVLRLENFLTRNGQPHRCLDPETDPEAAALIEPFHPVPADLPIVLCPTGEMLRNPDEATLARCIGMVEPIDPNTLYDVAIIGAGPAGLAAAVYAGSEGLKTLVVDAHAFGGQAGASARIENYLGFPTGITGLSLMGRAYSQAQKFGVELAIPDKVTGLTCRDGTLELALQAGETARARAVVIASGARYRKLDHVDVTPFESASVHYWASPLEARLCAGQEVALVGAGNSAGQAAVFLAARCVKVFMLIRGEGLSATMSRYLVDRIQATPNIELVTGVEVCGLDGQQGKLDACAWRHRTSGEITRRDIRHLFLLIGAEPNTDWLADAGVERDRAGFVLTGDGCANHRAAFETSLDGVFAIGDARAGSVKRVAAGVGEGAQVVAALHAYLAKETP
ncbi:thioredoxin reductase (NADPH) [Caulobacter ginsengisoli]|uniref:Thioredoxin reductase n=1 Tax=Caulobacter ginsengisoli TaxID=400775 RepID=A0ABU0ITK7_9CAUL|nr:FAD-dependent oxidoreductase [Caulobacter ginsengisoli]MDQ0465342.1 thioredoxin reductase (NADPH) [Caulobacter ginsengisoli]